jgi:phage shock protein E
MRDMSTLLWAICYLALSSCGEAQSDSKKTAGQPKAETKITHVDAAQAGKLIADKKVVVLDIRTPKEFAAGHIAGGKNIDFYATDFEKDLAALDKDKTYLVHCGSGGRSTRSLESFKKLGFKSVVHLDGGFKAWEKAGKPIESQGSK